MLFVHIFALVLDRMCPLSSSASWDLSNLHAEVYGMENDSTPSGFAGLIEKIRKWSAPFIGVALFVFGLGKGVKEVQENLVWAIAAAVSVGWLFLFWIYTSKKNDE